MKTPFACGVLLFAGLLLAGCAASPPPPRASSGGARCLSRP